MWAPTPRYQMPGITRRNVLELCRAHGIPCRELDFTLTQVWGWVVSVWTWVCAAGWVGGIAPVALTTPLAAPTASSRCTHPPTHPPSQVYSADEAFVTGTFAGQASVGGLAVPGAPPS